MRTQAARIKAYASIGENALESNSKLIPAAKRHVSRSAVPGQLPRGAGSGLEGGGSRFSMNSSIRGKGRDRGLPETARPGRA